MTALINIINVDLNSAERVTEIESTSNLGGLILVQRNSDRSFAL